MKKVSKKSKIALCVGLTLIGAALITVDETLGLIACGVITFVYVRDGEVRRMF